MSTMEAFGLEIGRTRTASGWEWFLLLGGERVQTNDAQVGLFTDADAQPADVLATLLARVGARQDEVTRRTVSSAGSF
jgi:hypothetical protein